MRRGKSQNQLTRVLERIVLIRGKSAVPLARMEILLSRSERDVRRELTDDERELSALDCVRVFSDWDICSLFSILYMD